MLDSLFIHEAPDWLNMMFESLIKEITIDLEEDSEYFHQLRKQINSICHEHPEFEAVVENDTEQKALCLSAEETKKLALLIWSENEVMELYQRMLYLKGCRDGICLTYFIGIKDQKQ